MYASRRTAISNPNAAKYFRKYSIGCIINMLTAHKIANSIEKKNGVTFPFRVNPFLSFCFISSQCLLFKSSSLEEVSKFSYKLGDLFRCYCLKASSLSLAIGCQKYSKTVCCPLIISTCAIIPGLSGTVEPLLSFNASTRSTSIAYIYDCFSSR